MATEAPELAEGVTPAARTRELERELRLMGPINPLALQEYEELQERHQFLQAQLDDVKSSRRDLAKVIKAIDEEIVSVFAAAYADVSANFELLFETLFPGGVGRLKLTLPDDLLNTGIEARGQAVGQEREEAVAALGRRAVARPPWPTSSPCSAARPSPFYVMDEVEAALDDVNLHRFLGPGGRVPPGRPAAHRQPPEAHDGGRRRALRRHHAARRVVAGRSASGCRRSSAG